LNNGRSSLTKNHTSTTTFESHNNKLISTPKPPFITLN
jgi:hypothetical protein